MHPSAELRPSQAARVTADAAYEQAMELFAAGRLDEAVEWLNTAIATDASNAEYRYALGRLHKERGDPDDAERSYREALDLRPEYVEAWVSLGILLRHRGLHAQAEACQLTALRIDPSSFAATLNLGTALYLQGRLTEAVECLRRAVEQKPDSAEAHNNLGKALLDMQVAEAGEHFLGALRINPEYFEAAENLGTFLFRMGAVERAVAAFSTAVKLKPREASTRLLLANALTVGRQFERAGEEYLRLIDEYPQLPHAHGGLAVLLAARGQYTKPRALFEKALAEAPDNDWMRFHYSTFLLRNGHFDRAWDYYESRWQFISEGGVDSSDRAFTQPRWRGEPLEGATLLITCEQGLGDEIMFASLFAEIARSARHCIFECDERLAPLFRRSFPGATVYGVPRKGGDWFRILERNLQQLPSFDVWTPAGSLPARLRRSAESFPAHSGYLQADPDRVRHWKARLAALGPGLKVGISWRGGTALSNTATRSCTLQQLRPILALRNAHFVSLQYGDCAREIDEFAAQTGITLHHWQGDITDYDDTAALVCALDLVVSVCTALVHLGGALGRPVWAMAPYVAEWRYGRSGPAMAWYPSVRLFRQPRPDAWGSVVAEVKRALSRAPLPSSSTEQRS